MTVEEVYTDAFDNTVRMWAEVGSSPYLQDSDDDYVWIQVLSGQHGDWTFPVSAGSGTINSVKIRLEGYVGESYPDTRFIAVYVWNGSWFETAGIIYPNTDYAWHEFDVTSILDTWAKINGAKVRIAFTQTELVGAGYARRLTRKVDYTPAVPPKVPLGDGIVFVQG